MGQDASRRTRKRGGRPGRKPEPGERLHLGVLVAPSVKKRIEEIANENGRSMSQEAELRLVRSLDRQDLLPEVLTLTFGRRLAGMLMLLGLAMNTAAKYGPANQDEDWATETEAVYAAQHATKLLFHLWRAAHRRSSSKSVVMASRAQGTRAVETVIGWLNREMTKPEGKQPIGTILKLLGPIATEMIEEWPREKKRIEIVHDRLMTSIRRTIISRREAQKP